jgi:hypothetical protein
MPAIKPLDYLGQSWSLWPPSRNDGSLKIVARNEKISAHIISILLLRPGEDLMHPEMPMAPDIFDPLSGYNANYWVFHAEEKIRRWVNGLNLVKVNIVENNYDSIPDVSNSLTANISFSTNDSGDTNALTFGWHEYQGMFMDRGNSEAFFDSVYLNSNKLSARFDGFYAHP